MAWRTMNMGHPVVLFHDRVSLAGLVVNEFVRHSREYPKGQESGIHGGYVKKAGFPPSRE